MFRRLLHYSIFLVPCSIFVSGCAALTGLSESVKNKNIAIGRDLWGGDVQMTMISEENPCPTINLWFGRSRTWYVSLKDHPEIIPSIVEKSNSAIEVKASATGVSMSQSVPVSAVSAPSTESTTDSAK
jgi:hypothetical protein